ncbi:MAG TPA: hypothetical protein VIL03_01205 [Clostridia bacterium]
MNTIFKISSYITSLIPFGVYILTSLYLYKDTFFEPLPKYIRMSLFCIIVAILIIFLLYYIAFLVIKFKKHESSKKIKVLTFTKQRANTSNYLLQNVLPLISLLFCEFNYPIIIFLILLLILFGIMYIKNELYFINPLFDIIGVKIYEVQALVAAHGEEYSTNTKNYIVITTKKSIELLVDNNYIELDNGVIFLKD